MNVVKEISRINELERKHGIKGAASWHNDYKDTAWVFVGGLSEKLSEGDLLAVLSQYGEIEDVHLIRDEDTGKSKGFSFVKYFDQRSTVLAVDNLNEYKLLGRMLRVDHARYEPPQKSKEDIAAQEEADSARAREGLAPEEVALPGPGHAYVDKELKSGHSLGQGHDLFGAPVVAESVGDEGGKKRKSEKKAKKEKKGKKEKKEKKGKKEKKEKKEKSAKDKHKKHKSKHSGKDDKELSLLLPPPPPPPPARKAASSFAAPERNEGVASWRGNLDPTGGNGGGRR